MSPKTKTINIMLLDGGVGDHIASLVAVNYILKNYPWITPLIWTPDFLIDFARNVLPKDTNILRFSDLRGRYDPSKPTKTTKWDGITSPMKIHCLDYAFLKLCDENPSIEHKNYLKINSSQINISAFRLPSKYVVITTGFTAIVREFRAKYINEIMAYIKSKGYIVVFLGQKATKTGNAFTIKGTFSAEVDYTSGVDLIDKTSLLEAAKIMEGSKAVIGIDNGLLHIAGCTDTAIVGGFTTVSPSIRMPVRYNELGWNFYPVVPDLSLDCRFCQEKTNFLYGRNYTKCCKDVNSKEYLNCTKQMTSNKFIEQLNKIL